MRRAALRHTRKCSRSPSERWLHSICVSTNSSSCVHKINWYIISQLKKTGLILIRLEEKRI